MKATGFMHIEGLEAIVEIEMQHGDELDRMVELNMPENALRQALIEPLECEYRGRRVKVCFSCSEAEITQMDAFTKE